MPSEKIRAKAELIQSADYRKERAKRLLQARKTIGMGREQLARKIGVAHNTLASIENGESNVKVKDLELIALFTKQDVLWLMFGDVIKQRNHEVMKDYHE